jgi:hypothetical protein
MSSDAIDRAVAAVRSFVHLSGALRTQALVEVERGGSPALVSCTRLGPIEVVLDGQEVAMPHDVVVRAAAPDLGDLRPLPPFEVDPAAGEVAGVIGGLDLLAEAMRRLAAAVGGPGAVVAEMETTTPDQPLVLSARLGEPVLVTLGEDSYEL